MLRRKNDEVNVDIAMLAITGALLTALLYGPIWIVLDHLLGYLGTAMALSLALVATWSAARGVDPLLERKHRLGHDARHHRFEAPLTPVGAIVMILFRGDLRAGCGSILIGGPRNLVLAWRLWRSKRDS